MAAPSEITITNLSGKYVMNKGLSDPIDATLALQGLSWLTRKAIGLATVVLTIKQYKDEKSVYHIDIISVASGLTTTEELRTLDWTDRPHNDKIFGKVEGRSRLFKEFEKKGPASDEDVVFLLGKKLKDGTDSNFLDDEHVQAWVHSVDGKGWQAEMVWGFEEVNKERRYTRRVVVWNGDKVERCRLVYDYKGQAEKSDEDALAYGE